MKSKLSAVLLVVTALLAGCAGTPQAPLSLNSNFYADKSKTIGVYMDPLPKPNTLFAGAGCLLCMAVVETANASLTTQTKTFSTDELAALQTMVVDSIKKKGGNVVIIDSKVQLDKLKSFSGKGVNLAKDDYRPLKASLGVDKLVVIDLNAVGVYRPYAEYVPTGAPTGYVAGLLYTVDLNTNEYDLYEPIDFKVGVQGQWDEAPKFPGVTSAYYQAVEQTKDKVISSFK